MYIPLINLSFNNIHSVFIIFVSNEALDAVDMLIQMSDWVLIIVKGIMFEQIYEHFIFYSITELK